MYSLSTILANITEEIDLTEKVYETELGPIRVESVSVDDILYRISIPSIGTEIVTNREDRGDAVSITIRYFGTSPGSNLEIEKLLNRLYDTVTS